VGGGLFGGIAYLYAPSLAASPPWLSRSMLPPRVLAAVLTSTPLSSPPASHGTRRARRQWAGRGHGWGSCSWAAAAVHVDGVMSSSCRARRAPLAVFGGSSLPGSR
jgi:hypothetical protein